MTSDRLRRAMRRAAALFGADDLFGRAIAFVVLVSAWVATWRPQADPDFGWHLRIGDAILATGIVPTTDTFSWLTAGQPFAAHSWAWDVILAAAYRSAGLMGTSLVALPVSGLAIVLIWTLLKLVAPGVPPFPRSVLVAMAIVIGLPVWSPRAQIWDVVFVLACALLWSLWLRRGRVLAFAFVPVISILWVNLHGSGALAFVPCVLALAVAIPVGVKWETWSRPSIRPLALSTAAAIAAFGLNPSGLDIVLLPANGDVGSPFLASIIEWQSPHFGDTGFAAFRVVLAAAVLVAFALRGRARDPLFLLLAAGWTFVALGAARFSLIAGPCLVIALAPAIARSGRAWLGLGRQPAGPPSGPNPKTSNAPFLAAGAAVVLAAIIAVGGLVQIAPGRQRAQAAASFPVAAVEWLLQRQCHGRILNAYDWGGYLTAAWPDPVATYGSSPKGLVEDEVRLETLETDPRTWLDSHHVELVLMPTGGPLDRWLDEAADWTVGYRDNQATLQVRTGLVACAVTASAADAQIQ